MHACSPIHRVARCCALAALFAGCTEPEPAPDGPLPRWSAEPEGFYDAPWPSDRYRDDDGTVSWRRFPDPSTVDLVEDYLARAEELPGWGTSSPMYLPFEGPIEPERLPTPLASTVPGASLFVIDIDPSSPEWGQRVPVRAEVLQGETEWYPEHVLAVGPVPGFPLRPSTTYALVATTALASPHPEFAATLEPGHALHDPQLAHTLAFHGQALDEVAVATVFTTYDPVAEMARIADFVQHDIAPPDLARFELERLLTSEHYIAWRTHYPSPVFTSGERPYYTEGGGFSFDADGVPIVDTFDDMRASVCTPVDLSSPPPTGWPVVIYQHGTGGDYRTHCNSNGAFEVARRLGEVGVVSIGLDQPLHGTRQGEVPSSDLAHFNFANPDSAVTNFRQGAIDAIYLARALADRPWVLRTEDGQQVPLDPDRVMFVGHSQGGLTGAIAAPFWGHDVKATVLSGAGAVLSITLMERKDIFDFQALIEGLLGFDEDEELTELHPALALIQTLSEVTDTVNYAPYWTARRGSWRGHAPSPVLLTNGTLDPNTPYRTAVALAAAGHLPLVGEAATDIEALYLRGLVPSALPSASNVEAFDGSRLTSGFAQYDGGSHFVIFEEEHAAQLYVNYVRTTADGRPSLRVEEGLRQ
jgi:pimeloyl-ACP methyl ester carboxylesterase